MPEWPEVLGEVKFFADVGLVSCFAVLVEKRVHCLPNLFARFSNSWGNKHLAEKGKLGPPGLIGYVDEVNVVEYTPLM